MADQNPLRDLLDEYMADRAVELRTRVQPADLARWTDVSDKLISKWRNNPGVLPEPDQLLAIAKGTGLDYLDLLDAALRGKGYLPIGGEVRLRLAGKITHLDFARPDEEADEENVAKLTPRQQETADFTEQLLNRQAAAAKTRKKKSAATLRRERQNEIAEQGGA